jgi:polar amino acid transport system substrate-binding protein
MRDAINFAIQRIAKSGRYERIYNTWFGPESATPMPEAGEIEIWPDG